MSDASPRPAAYHHGDLRRALLDTAGLILAETGGTDFSLREVARRAGVSHAAAYRHFADKEDLAAALAVAGYEALRARTEAALAGADGAAEALTRIGRAYVAFGVGNPALYRLMFGRAGASPRPEAPSPLRDARGAARAVLRGVIVDGARTGAFALDPTDAPAVSVAVVAAWSLVHGLALLAIDRAFERDLDPEAVDALAARVIARLVAGLGPGP